MSVQRYQYNGRMTRGVYRRYAPYAHRVVGAIARYGYQNRGRIARTALSYARRSLSRYFDRTPDAPSSRSTPPAERRGTHDIPSAVSSSGGAGGYYVGPPRKVTSSGRPRYGGRLKRKGSRKTNARRGKVMKALMQHVTTPQTLKATVAFNRGGLQGQRQFASVELCGESFLTHIANFKPANFLYNTAAGVTTPAVLQDFSVNTWQLALDKLVWDMRIQNRSNASMELKVYECIARHDISSSNFGRGTNAHEGVFQDDTDPPSIVGNNSLGPAQQPLSTGTGKGTSQNVTHMWQHPGFTPYNSPEFCEAFKIVNTYTIKLGPNEITSKKFYQKGRLFKGRWLTSSLSLEWQRNWSKLLLFSWVGMPVDDGTLTNQTKAQADLFVQADITAKFCFTPGCTKLSNFEFANNVNTAGQNYWFNPTGFTPALPVDQTVQTTASTTVGVVAP